MRGRPKPASAPLRPPWILAGAFEDGCTRCGDCVQACPEGILVLGDGGYPAVDFNLGGCTYCKACAEACPEPIFDLEQTPPWSYQVEISGQCLARRGVYCQSCGDPCAVDAIRFTLRPGRLAVPLVDVAACTGCGACVAVCPVGAIAVRPLVEAA